MPREQWSSGPGFVLASIGSIALFLFGLPLLILELALGRHFRTSVVPAFGTRGRPFRLAGFVLVFILTMILSYYLVVTGWILAYFAAFARGAPLGWATSGSRPSRSRSSTSEGCGSSMERSPCGGYRPNGGGRRVGGQMGCGGRPRVFPLRRSDWLG